MPICKLHRSEISFSADIKARFSSEIIIGEIWSFSEMRKLFQSCKIRLFQRNVNFPVVYMQIYSEWSLFGNWEDRKANQMERSFVYSIAFNPKMKLNRSIFKPEKIIIFLDIQFNCNDKIIRICINIWSSVLCISHIWPIYFVFHTSNMKYTPAHIWGDRISKKNFNATYVVHTSSNRWICSTTIIRWHFLVWVV